MKRGKVGHNIKKIIKEMRGIMYPYTAINLKESKTNSLKDFLSIVDVYGLSHMMLFTSTPKCKQM